MYGNLCFEDIMANNTLEQHCSCPMECDSISYSFSVVSTPFNEMGLCAATLDKPTPLMKEFYEKPFPKVFIRKLKRFILNETDSTREICKRYVKYRAEIKFKLATNKIAVTITSKRLSSFDELSGFGKTFAHDQFTIDSNNVMTGGTLGLFTGMSILSLVEVAFWIVRFFAQSLRSDPLKKQAGTL